MFARAPRLAACALLAALGGCLAPIHSTDLECGERTCPDAAIADAAELDAGSSDTGTVDAGGPDAGLAFDAGGPDGALLDSGGPALDAGGCQEWYASTFTHEQEGRGVKCGAGGSYVCAVGSNDNLGLWNTGTFAWVRETAPGFYEAGRCDAADAGPTPDA